MQNLRAGAAIAALSIAMLAAPAAARAEAEPGKPAEAQGPAAQAPAAPEQEAPTGDVIVTATKRAESVQRVPLAVSVATPAQLQAAGVRNFSDIGKIAPSLIVRPAEQPQNSNISLRGVGTFAFGIGVESSVAVLVDEVPLAFQARAFTDLPDIQRLEVLRGPQSTLYGKSASAGLINFITRNPTSDLRFRGNAVVTTDREGSVNFSVSGPVAKDVGFIFSAAYNNWEGNVRNLFNGKRVNGRESIDLRGKLRWEPTSDTSLTLSLNYVNGNTTVGRPFIRIGPNARLRGDATLTPAAVFPGVTIAENNQNISNNFDSRTNYQGGGGYIRGEIGLGAVKFVTISSYDRFNLNDFLDHDDTSAQANFGNNTQIGTFNSEQLTQEVRLQSVGDGPFQYTVGLYLAGVSFNRPFQRGPFFSLANWYATSESRQIAGFAQADWRLLPGLTFTGGGRVLNERVSYSFQDNLARTFFSGAASDTAATYRASLRYDFTPDINGFVSYATGYKGQTYDLTTGFNLNRALAGPIRPERSRDTEIGLRTQWFNRRLTLNVTLFNTDYTNLQAQTIETLADGTTNFRLTNVGGLNTRGVEFEGALRIGEDLNLNGAVTYLDAIYTSFAAAQCYPLQNAATGCTGTPARQNLTGTRAIQAPQWRLNFGGDFTPRLTGSLRGIGQFNWQYQSALQFTSNDPQTFQPGYHILNLGIGIRDDKRRWELVGFINNVFDQQYYGALVNTAGNFGNNIATQAILPRDFRRYGGVRLGVNF